MRSTPRSLAPSHVVACGAIALALTCLSVVAAPAGIATDSLLQHIKFLASDDFKGRANGSAELDAAGAYISQQFQAVGLQPGGTSDEWFQPFQLNAGLTVGSGNRLSVSAKGRAVNFTLGASYYPLSAPANEDPARPSSDLRDLQVVFAGYGLAVPDIGYDDYRRVEVGGKAVLIFSHEPQERDAGSRLNGVRPMPQTSLAAKAALARSKGARMLLVVSDPSHRVDDAPYGLFANDPDAEDEGIPVLRIRRQEAQPLLDAWQLDAVARQIDSDLVPRSRALPDGKVEYVEYLAKNRRTVRNVIGVLPGSDPARSKEAIVIGAHYDHVGFGGRLSVTPEKSEIHNGADDNASGTAAIIEMARAAVVDRSRFPRTLVFVAFAGEERGLLGSAHYVNQPRVPIESTIAMLNLDMVGRANGSVDISGLETAPSMEPNLAEAVTASGASLKIKREGPGAGRSDDYNFIARRIPAINFFTGFHNDYHRPGDDWQKIDAAGTSEVARLALEFAVALANRTAKPEFVATK
jgi:Peptidase family M28/PA domain